MSLHPHEQGCECVGVCVCIALRCFVSVYGTRSTTRLDEENIAEPLF